MGSTKRIVSQHMYLDFFKLREQPFGETPDPRYLYLSTTHREAIASLAYGIEAGRGFLVLVADPGMGKTTLLFHLLEWLRGSARTAFLFQTQCDSRELLSYLLSDLGINSQEREFVRIHEQLKQVLITEAATGRRVVIFIDEAQNLTESVLETVRLLSDYESPRSKLVQIILAGQPQLAEKLARPDLAQLCQRVSILSRLKPFTLSETEAYINHRLSVASFNGGELFTPEARAMIATWSGGVPRNINHLCFNALSLGFAAAKHEIDGTIVQEAMSDMERNPLLSEPGSPQRYHSELAPRRSKGPCLTKVASSKEESSVAGAVVPLSRPELEAVATSTDHLGKDATPRGTTTTLSVWSKMVLVGASLITFFMVEESQRLFFYHVVPQPVVTSSIPIPTLLVAKSQSQKLIESLATAARPSQPPLTGRKETLARTSKVLDGKSLAAPTALARFTPDTIHPETAPNVTGLPSDISSDGLQAVFARSWNVLSVPAPLAEKSVPMHVGGRVKEPRRAFWVPPIYPPEAKHSGIEGEVVIDAVIEKNGRPTNLKVVSGPTRLQAAALNSLREWQYKPGSLDDKPIPVEMLISFEFRLRRPSTSEHAIWLDKSNTTSPLR